MTDPTMIAVVPAPEWREVLLGWGPCGGLPPRVVDVGTGRWQSCTDSFTQEEWGRRIEALPLLWEGQPVPDGIARATTHGLQAIFQEFNDPYAILGLARGLVDAGIASEVIIEPGVQDG